MAADPHLVNGTLLLLLGYTAALIAFGLWIGRRVSSTGGFFVAGRALGPGLIFSTVLAANIGAGSTIGAAGLGYRDGVAGWWWVGSAGIGTLALAFWVGPRIWAIAREHGHLTVGDYLEHRYGRSVRAILATLLWFGTHRHSRGPAHRDGRHLRSRRGLAPRVGSARGGAGHDDLLHGRWPAHVRVGQLRPADRARCGLWHRPAVGR